MDVLGKCKNCDSLYDATRFTYCPDCGPDRESLTEFLNRMTDERIAEIAQEIRSVQEWREQAQQGVKREALVASAKAKLTNEEWDAVWCEMLATVREIRRGE